MRYTSGPGFDSRWQPNIFNSVLFKKPTHLHRTLLMVLPSWGLPVIDKDKDEDEDEKVFVVDVSETD